MTGAKRWLGYTAVVIVFAVVCGLLAWWQFSRNAEAAERIRQVEDNWDREPVEIDQLLAEHDTALDPADTWTPVVLTGEYLVEDTLLVRGRPNDGQPGFEVLVPLATADGVVIVDRGWVPVGETQAEVPDAVPAPPTGEVTVVARLKAGEPGIAGRTAPEGQVATIELPLIDELLGRDDLYTGAYALLASETPAVATPVVYDRPDPDPGPHLSYALQWILFAVLAASALVWAVWNERRVRAMSDQERASHEARLAERRRDEDAAAEDALLDG